MSRRNYGLLLVALVAGGCNLLSGPKIVPSALGQTPAAVQPADNALVCPKCQGAMQAGMIRDYFNSNSYDSTWWSPAGEKQHLFSWGKRTKITVYRCSNCGYLESYAK